MSLVIGGGALLACIIAALYPLLGYPLVLACVGWLRPRPVRRQPFWPPVTIVIPAYNEVACIAATLDNKLALDYPRDLMQIIVVSDASDDGTDECVLRYADRGVQLLRQSAREGKAAGLNRAVRNASGEIIVFSDANSRFAPDAVRLMMENFADSEVGYVTGCLEFEHRGATSGRGGGAYMRYENWLRRIETRAGSIVGVNGGVDAMRRSLYSDVPADQISDFVLPLSVIETGHRVVYDERVQSREEANEQLGSEFRMRVRVALRALRGLQYKRALLNPLRWPCVAFCIVSHKVLRYATFLFLAAALVLNCLLARQSTLFAWLLAAQACAYLLAATSLIARLPRPVRAFSSLPGYFVVSNVAFAVAAWRFLRGETMATWRPRGG